MRMRISRSGSIQSKFTSRVSGFEEMVRARSSAMRRTSCWSGPLTRYCTGQPTGGPSSSAETRPTTFGNSSASSFSSRARSRSRASMPLVTMTACEKNSLGSWTSSGK